MKSALQREPQQTETRPVEYAVPEVNIFETGEGYVLQAEMPGVTREGLEIMLEGSEITILGHPHDTTLPGEVLFRESQPRTFRRVFELDPEVGS